MWARDAFAISNTLIPSSHVYKCNFNTIIYTCKQFSSSKRDFFSATHTSKKELAA